MTGPVLIRLPIVVRFSDCDPLGHVNNAVYLTYLEQARIDLWRKQIGPLGRRLQDGTRGEGFILARAEVDFRAQARDGDTLEVRLALAGFGTKSATYDYEIIDVSTGRVVVTARTVQVWFDYDAGRSIAISDATKEVLRRPVGDWDQGGTKDQGLGTQSS